MSIFDKCKIYFKPQNNFLMIFRSMDIYPRKITLTRQHLPPLQKWALPSLKMNASIVANKGFHSKINSKMANSVDPDETARSSVLMLILRC